MGVQVGVYVPQSNLWWGQHFEGLAEEICRLRTMQIWFKSVVLLGQSNTLPQAAGNNTPSDLIDKPCESNFPAEHAGHNRQLPSLGP